MNDIDHKALLQRFLDYVHVDSETGDEGGMAERLVADLTALGFAVTTDEITESAKTTGCNVYATLEGDPALEPLFFSAHMDTVIPGKGVKPHIDNGYVCTDGTTVLGGDDKAGIAAIIEAMIAAKETNHRTVEAVFTVREESGMFGAKNMDYGRIRAKRGVVLDSGGGPNDIIVGAPGQNKITAKFIGKRSHAGLEPEKGISAIQVAAHAVAAMELLRIDFETTCNIGTFKAEGPTNIVTEVVDFFMEVRSRNTDKLNAHTQHIIDCMEGACQKFGATLDYNVATSYLGYSFPEQDSLVQMVADASRAIGLTPSCGNSGGGSDANVFNQYGIEAVVIGNGMEKVHTTAERLCICQMEQAAEACYQLMTAQEN